MLEVFTDGATVGHNGKLGTVQEVGLGVYIPAFEIKISKREKGISNNEAEFKALILAMEKIIELGLEENTIYFFMDSQIVVNRANGKRAKGKYKNERMDAFQDDVFKLAKMIKDPVFMWVPRESNTMADALSKQACE